MIIDPPSCARTDAKPLDRDEQIKYDIAKNAEGPLSRTVKHPPPTKSSKAKGKQKAKHPGSQADAKPEPGQNGVELTSDRHPALDERLMNIESHLSVRYGELHVWLICVYTEWAVNSSFTTAYTPRSAQVPREPHHPA
jgi:hypothetical protein